MQKEKTFKLWCNKCLKKHLMIYQKCSSCGVYFVLQPKSDKIADKCPVVYECDGCEAYREHLSV